MIFFYMRVCVDANVDVVVSRLLRFLHQHGEATS